MAQIAVYLGRRLGAPTHWLRTIALEAIDHDIDEVLTGDAPTPSKVQDPDKYRGILSEKLIVKIADLVEAYVFIVDNKVDRHGDKVEKYVENNINLMLACRPVWEQAKINDLINDLLHSEYTI